MSVPHPIQSPAERAMVEALRLGDESSFERLVDQHQGALHRLARMYLPNASLVEDVVQDTWLAVIRGLWAFEGRSSLKTWIFRILINRAKTQAMRERRTVALPDAGLEDGATLGNVGPGRFVSETSAGASPWNTGAPDRAKTASSESGSLRAPGPSPEAMLLSKETGSRIQAAIDALPRNQRLVITMRDVEGWSSEEVCNVLDLTETNQRVLLHRARSRVRSMLSAYLGEE